MRQDKGLSQIRTNVQEHTRLHYVGFCNLIGNKFYEGKLSGSLDTDILLCIVSDSFLVI